jgi:ABC-type bacteriocin/lantibiotic exporter with double-glycine peptidase domain
MITTSSNTIQLGISEKLSTLIQSTALTISAYAIAFRYSWVLTLVATSPIVFISLVYSVILPITVKLQRKIEQSDEMASSIAGEIFGSVRTIVACGAEKRLGERYARWMEESRRRGLGLSPIMGASYSPAFFAMYCDFALTFWYGLRLYHQGTIKDVGTVVT